MEQLIELLKQIQDLAGVGIDALNEAASGGGPADAAAEGAPTPEGDGASAPEGAPAGPPRG